MESSWYDTCAWLVTCNHCSHIYYNIQLQPPSIQAFQAPSQLCASRLVTSRLRQRCNVSIYCAQSSLLHSHSSSPVLHSPIPQASLNRWCILLTTSVNSNNGHTSLSQKWFLKTGSGSPASMRPHWQMSRSSSAAPKPSSSDVMPREDMLLSTLAYEEDEPVKAQVEAQARGTFIRLLGENVLTFLLWEDISSILHCILTMQKNRAGAGTLWSTQAKSAVSGSELAIPNLHLQPPVP